MYLRLSDFDHLRSDPTVRFREETVNGRELVIICYMISNDELWDKRLGKETRGATFDKQTGYLVSLPFEKFFNVNEKSFTQADVVSKYRVNSVLDKLDGSMISPAVIDGEVFLKTKKSFYSDVAQLAQRSMPANVRALCKNEMDFDFCPIFEFTSPDSKIVINYGDKPKFTLLALRDLRNGEYMSYDQVKACARRYDVACVQNFAQPSDTVRDYLRKAETAEDIEGWVLYTTNGRFKIKTKWYMDRHRLIDVRERDIAGYVLDDTLDDMIPNLIEGQADMAVVRDIERTITNELSSIIRTVEDLGRTASGIPLGKERADWINSMAGELSKFVHRAARGHENSDEAFREFYRTRYLSNFSLRSIGNPNFRTGEDNE